MATRNKTKFKNNWFTKLKKPSGVSEPYNGSYVSGKLGGVKVGNESLSPYAAIPLLLPRHRAYVSFISALHLYGIIEQIPQVITLASTAHTKTIHTKIGTFSIHQITPLFFIGFNWYKGTGDFLIADPEKAFVDSLYLSACKKKQLGYFPELHFPKSFSFKKVKDWIKTIPDPKIRSYVQKKIEANNIFTRGK